MFSASATNSRPQAHQLEQEQLHQAAQRIHLQTRQIEQQRTIERQISHGIDFRDM